MELKFATVTNYAILGSAVVVSTMKNFARMSPPPQRARELATTLACNLPAVIVTHTVSNMEIAVTISKQSVLPMGLVLDIAGSGP